MLDRMLLREYKATAALYRALPPDPEIGAVRPIAILPEHRALATEEVPGRPFADLLTDESVSGQELIAIARRIGTWARLYQQLVPADGTVVLAERRTYLDQRLQLLEGRVLTAAERAACLDFFDALCREIGSTEVPAVPIHADLSPTNIIVDATGRIAVLDFTMAKTGTVHHDLSHVYFHLELLAMRDRRRRALMTSLQRAMCDGYRPGMPAADPLFRLMLLQHVVCHIALLAERRVPLIDAAYRWYLRRRWRRCQRIPAVIPAGESGVPLRSQHDRSLEESLPTTR
jgi:Ser/Thr protein kinase RdoA (MazF antagonist)